MPQWSAPPPPRRRGGTWLWVLLPATVLAVMVGYLVLTHQSGSSGDGTGDADVTYVNEEYTVPGADQGPTTVVDPLDDPSVLDRNPFYAQTVPVPVRCEADDVTDLSSTSQLAERLSDLSECLTRTFGPALEDAGFEAFQPRVTVYQGEGGEGPCGELPRQNAFFCAINQRIYFAQDLGDLVSKDLAAWDYVMAHEYAHNVQGRTGILVQRHYSARSAHSKAEALEVNRRLEVQADCLAGSFIRSGEHSLGYGASDRRRIVRTAERTGDDIAGDNSPGTHGRSANRVLWTERGLEARTYEDCNTFVAPEEEVR